MQADILFRPAGAEFFHHRRNARNVSLGGMRVYSDEELTLGSRLDLDVLLADQPPVRVWASVVWIVKLNSSAPARFDVGLRFTDLEPDDMRRLAAVLVPAG